MSDAPGPDPQQQPPDTCGSSRASRLLINPTSSSSSRTSPSSSGPPGFHFEFLWEAPPIVLLGESVSACVSRVLKRSQQSRRASHKTIRTVCSDQRSSLSVEPVAIAAVESFSNAPLCSGASQRITISHSNSKSLTVLSFRTTFLLHLKRCCWSKSMQ